jgi:peroxin-6
LAKAVATECGLAFLSVKGPELLDMYVGESERNVRQAFARARAAAPAVLFFDELDSLAPQRGRGSDSGGVMDRVVAQLLVELDAVAPGAGGGGGGGGQGGTERKDVFVIGATNRPDLLDSSLLRPGRFDRLLYLGHTTDAGSRRAILQAATRKFPFGEDVDLSDVVSRLPPNFTGADFSAVAAQALMRALRRRVAELEEELAVFTVGGVVGTVGGTGGGKLSLGTFLSHLSPEECVARVYQEDLLEAATKVAPSVAAEELAHYERLRLQFSSTQAAVGLSQEGSAAVRGGEKGGGREALPVGVGERTGFLNGKGEGGGGRAGGGREGRRGGSSE